MQFTGDIQKHICRETGDKRLCNGVEIHDGELCCTILTETYKEGKKCPFYSCDKRYVVEGY